jgi:hypothetical protein
MSTNRQNSPFTKCVRIVVLGLGMFGTTHPASATAILTEFRGDTAGGTLSRDGGIGIFLDVLSVAVGGEPRREYDLGGYASGGDGGSSAVMVFDAVRRTFSILGTIPELGILSPTQLAIGTFTSARESLRTVGDMDFSTISFDETLTDTKAPLMAALGLPPGTMFVGSGMAAGQKHVKGPYGVTSAALTSIGDIVAPEPGSLVLLGTGLVVLAHTVRKRLRRSRESSQRTV